MLAVGRALPAYSGTLSNQRGVQSPAMPALHLPYLERRDVLMLLCLHAAGVASLTAGAIAVVATYPLDLVRTRLAWATEAPSKAQLAAVAAGRGWVDWG